MDITYYVLPNQNLYRGMFLVSLGSNPYKHPASEGEPYTLVAVTEKKGRKKGTYSLTFSKEGKNYKCSGTRLINGLPTVMQGRRLIEAPKELRRFAYPETKVTIFT